MNGDPARPRVGAFAGEPVRPEFDFTPSTNGWLPPPRLELGAPDYGVDSPGVVLRAFGFATATALTAIVAGAVRPGGRTAAALAPAFWLASLASAAFGAARLAYAKRGKLALRDRLLDLITWTGAERVLDVGTGGGLLMIGAAKRLTVGKAVGVDSWRQSDLTQNTRESAMRNAYFEGVVEKVDVRYEDARKLGTCTRNSFDVVFAAMTFRHLGDAAGRAAACKEIARVLKPGGTAVIADDAHGAEIKRALAAQGLEITRDTSELLRTYAYVRTIVAVKPRVENRPA